MWGTTLGVPANLFRREIVSPGLGRLVRPKRVFDLGREESFGVSVASFTQSCAAIILAVTNPKLIWWVLGIFRPGFLSTLV